MPTLSGQQVVETCITIFQAAGVSPQDSRVIAEHIARANLCGHDSHGIQNVSRLVSLVKKGSINPAGRWKVVRESAATALIDGDWAFGQVVCSGAVRLVIEKARAVGVGSAGIFNCSHIGRLGDYTTAIAEQGLIGMIYANTLPGVAPFGGRTRVLGTNPVSYAFPTQADPIMVDFATSIVAEGKVRAAMHKGLPIPEGWIVDRNGNSTTNPKDLYPNPGEPISAGGALLPAAGHKGYSLAVTLDLLCGALTGSGIGKEIKSGNGVFLQAINIESFTPMTEYLAHVHRLISELKNAPPATGVEEILLPGEPELQSKQKRLAEGIQVPDSAWQELVKTSKELNVNIESIISGPTKASER
ncbi:MAG TPA: Ldh family oxidoreductase [Nitrososphaerales archaeon]|nr:Ldh family oxidoreductase [Nitrososphaerales archaeon]